MSEAPSVSPENDNIQAFEKLLEKIEAAANGVKRDAGTRFETLTREWLLNEPTYKDLFTSVQTWADWAEAHPEYASNARDIGIDLVATNQSDGRFTAIQCKFYSKNATVPKSGIDSFIAASNKDWFTNRFIIATNEHWTENVLNELKGLSVPLTVITRSDMGKSMVDWSKYGQGKVIVRKPRTPRAYQKTAIEKVIAGFQTADRGKLIMACGTGKTYTSLKIAEQMQGDKGFVMFLVPSLSLLSQTLTDWKQQHSNLQAFAVCSDETTGKGDLEDIDSLTAISELTYPATTNAESLAKEVKKARAKDGMTVIFSTYQSIPVVHEAQKLFGMDEIGLVICDEAHRTAGGHFRTGFDKDHNEVDEEDSNFTRIHDNNYIRAKKRLYMTATPKIYGGEKIEKQLSENDIVLYSMDDESIFGKTFHEITFSEAVTLGSLVDYKVIVLTIDESVISQGFGSDSSLASDVVNGGLSVNHAAKIVGCWKALAKQGKSDQFGDDVAHMKRAVGFAQVINPNPENDRIASKAFAKHFPDVVDQFKKDLHDRLVEENGGEIDEEIFEQNNGLICDTKHIDGSMDATEKAAKLNWLREEPEDHHCKILFNVRCLSEGVDVPSLDAVLFLAPRKSMVDVVQTVGRVMRIAPGKQRGYVILPIVTRSNIHADTYLDNNKDFDVVWQILRALKSIDTNFGAMVDGQLQKINDTKMEVVCISQTPFAKKTQKIGRASCRERV